MCNDGHVFLWVSRVRRPLLVVCKGEASLVGGVTCWWCARARRHLLVVSLVGGIKGKASLVGGVQG